MAYRLIETPRHKLTPYVNPFAETTMTDEEKLRRDIQNAQTRLGAVGQLPNAPQTGSQNLIMKGLNLLDEPRNWLWKQMGMQVDPTTGRTSGEQILNKIVGAPSEKAGIPEKVARFVGSTGIEILGDPLTYLTFGLGGLVKGAATGVGRSMTRETAEALAKGALREVTPDIVEKVTRQQFEELAMKAVPKLGKAELQDTMGKTFKQLVEEIGMDSPEDTALRLLERYGTKGSNVGKLSDKKLLDLSDELRIIWGATDLDDATKVQATLTKLPDFKKEVGETLKNTTRDITEKQQLFMQSAYEANKGVSELRKGSGMVKEALGKAGIAESEYGGALRAALADVNKGVAEGAEHGYKDAFDSVQSSLADYFLRMNNIEKQMDKGLTVIGQTVIPGYVMQDLGAKWSNNLVKKHPVLQQFTDSLNAVFNTKFMKGVDASTANTFHAASVVGKGAYNQAINAAKHTYKELDKVFNAMPDGDEQRKMIKYIIENDMVVPENLKGAVNPETVNAAFKIRNEFQRILKAEQNLGLKAKTPMDTTYMARTPSMDTLERDLKRMNFSSITDALNISDPTRKRMYKTDFDTAQLMRNIDTSSSNAKTFIAEILDDVKDAVEGLPKDHALFGLFKRFNSESLKKHTPGTLVPIYGDDLARFRKYAEANPNDPISQYFDQLTQYMDGIEKFYEEDGVTAFITRVLQHERLLSNAKERDMFLDIFATQPSTMDDFAEAFADPTKKVVVKGLPNIYKLKVGKEIVSDVGEETGVELAKAPVSLGTTIKSLQKKAIDAHGAPIELSEGEFRALYQSDNVVPKAYVMPSAAYDKFLQTHKRQMDEGMSAVGNAIDTFHRIWKPTVTGLRPDYHVRNIIGSTAQSVLGGGAKALDPRDAWAGGMLVSKADNDVLVRLGKEDVSVKRLRDLAINNGIYQTMHRADLGTVKREITGAKPKAKGSNVLYGAERVADFSRSIGNAIEDRVRASYFVTNVRKGLEAGLDLNSAAKYAGDEVKRFHFDYSDLTNTERKLLQRAMPFYTWARKNIPLQLEMLMNEPRKYASLTRAVNNASNQFVGDDAELLPDYAKDEMAFATPFTTPEGSPVFLSGLFPMSDVRRLDPTGYLKETLGMMSPLAKAPMELGMNRELLTGRPITSGFGGETVPFMGMQADPRLAYLANQFGVVRNISGAVSGTKPGVYAGLNQDPTTRLATMDFSNSIVKRLDLTRAEENMLRDYLRDLQNQMQSYEFKTGEEIPTIRELLKAEKPPKYRKMQDYTK